MTEPLCGSFFCKSLEEIQKLIEWATLRRREWTAKTVEMGWVIEVAIENYADNPQWREAIYNEAGIDHDYEETGELKAHKWYWISFDGTNWFPAKRDNNAVGGWASGDIWEDFDHEVKFWAEIQPPQPSKSQ